MITLTIDVRAAQKKLDTTIGRVTDLRPVLQGRVLAAVIAMFKKWYDTRGNRSWPALKPSTIKDKRRRGFGGKPIMRRTDRLYRAVTTRGGPGKRIRVTKRRLDVSIAVPYAQHHQDTRPVVPDEQRVPKSWFNEVRKAIKDYVIVGKAH